VAKLPAIQDLDDMAFLVGRLEFDQLGPEARLQVIQLVLQADIGEQINALVDGVTELEKALRDVEVDTTKIGDWFKNSRLWEGH
jgi:hypothetical protein